jgi:serine/threonine protein kinase
VEAKSKDKRDVAYNDKVAIKFQPNTHEKEKAMNVDEVSLLKFCDHPNIVTLYRALQVRSEVWFIMELLKGGTLKQASTNKGVPFSEPEIAFVAREMLTGIHYLHSNQIAHRDLKNLNIMLTIEGGIKLIDFGLAVDLSLGPRVQMVGSPLWMAPEMIRGVPHSYGVDIWSFTVCMLELANQRPPNARNIKRAMFLCATSGMPPNKFDDPSKWSPDFEVSSFLFVRFLLLFLTLSSGFHRSRGGVGPQHPSKCGGIVGTQIHHTRLQYEANSQKAWGCLCGGRTLRAWPCLNSIKKMQ